MTDEKPDPAPQGPLNLKEISRHFFIGMKELGNLCKELGVDPVIRKDAAKAIVAACAMVIARQMPKPTKAADEDEEAQSEDLSGALAHLDAAALKAMLKGGAPKGTRGRSAPVYHEDIHAQWTEAAEEPWDEVLETPLSAAEETPETPDPALAGAPESAHPRRRGRPLGRLTDKQKVLRYLAKGAGTPRTKKEIREFCRITDVDGKDCTDEIVDDLVAEGVITSGGRKGALGFMVKAPLRRT